MSITSFLDIGLFVYDPYRQDNNTLFSVPIPLSIVNANHNHPD